jgi:predicted enzyme related to lactoylglutathione lyase
MLLQEGDAEVILHTDPNLPGQIEVYYLVDDVSAAILKFVDQGCKLLAEPFETRMGRGAVIQDPFGVRLCIQDMSRATVESDQF